MCVVGAGARMEGGREREGGGVEKINLTEREGRHREGMIGNYMNI